MLELKLMSDRNSKMMALIYKVMPKIDLHLRRERFGQTLSRKKKRKRRRKRKKKRKWRRKRKRRWRRKESLKV